FLEREIIANAVNNQYVMPLGLLPIALQRYDNFFNCASKVGKNSGNTCRRHNANNKFYDKNGTLFA
ncbi:MAG: hypothetical protein ACI4BD_01395, partial [Paludibacteraceae bacterium]